MPAKILVVDDEPDLASLIRLRFRRQIADGTYAFWFVDGGRAALDLLRAEPDFDVVLLDINLPDLNGLAVLEHLPGLLPSGQTVMVSAYGDMANIRRAMNLGAFDFVMKPIAFPDLEKTLEKTILQVEILRETARLKALDALKSRFFDNITHEFRTPLTLIQAPTEKLLAGVSGDETLRHHLGTVQRNAFRLRRLIDQLLALARLEAGHETLRPLPGDAGAFVGQLVAAFAPLAEQRGLDFSYENGLSQPYAFDADKLEHVVHNLVGNALKFTGAGGRVAVRFHPTETGVRLTVADTGIGIRPQKLPHVFDRFFQADDAPVRPYTGTGVGLALVREYVELMGGAVAVASEVGKGSVFTVELPLNPAEPTGPDGPPPFPTLPVFFEGPEIAAGVRERPGSERADLPSAPGNDDRPTVLVVEDSPELLQFLVEILPPDYRVLAANNGREAWEILPTELPDVVISDVLMPFMDGQELCRRVKTTPATRHVAVLLLTARAEHAHVVEGLALGADDYIAKPFYYEELLLRVRNLLDRQGHLREHFQRQFREAEAPFHPEHTDDQFLKSLYAAIEARLDDSTLGVDDLARAAAMSRRTLHRKLTAVAGLSPNELLRQYRLKRAAQLLRAGRTSAETAYLVGYESPAHFSTVFREFYGKTPTAFAER
jgi:signal transduction histidine kinase/AraC-like DNA-binding protein